MKVIEWSQHFSHYNTTVDFSWRPRAAYSAARGLIWQNFEPIWDFMVVLVTVPARMRKIQSKIKALERSQDYSLIFQTLKGS